MDPGKMKIIPVLTAFLVISGCATQYYKSVNPSQMVAQCIAQRWEKVGMAGTVPVSVEKIDNGYFVGVDLYPMPFSPCILGLKHPFHAVWAEVKDDGPGSATQYKWALQVVHGKLDKAVLDCQQPLNIPAESAPGVRSAPAE
jgi:hypothetical protein